MPTGRGREQKTGRKCTVFTCKQEYAPENTNRTAITRGSVCARRTPDCALKHSAEYNQIIDNAPMCNSPNISAE